MKEGGGGEGVAGKKTFESILPKSNLNNSPHSPVCSELYLKISVSSM